MFQKKIKLVLTLLILYQTPLYSKSNSFDNLDSKTLSKYFSGIIAFENKDNSKALDFFNSSKILIDGHDPYLKKYIYSLVLENKVTQAINIIKRNRNKDNSNFFDAYILLLLDSIKKNNFVTANLYLTKMHNLAEQDRINLAILEIFKQYVYVFKEKKILNSKKNLGKLSIISETFEKCYLKGKDADQYFLKLLDDQESDYTRYIYFYISYLIENNRILEAKKIASRFDYINTTLLLSQGKSWIENENLKNFTKVFSCTNPNDIIGEFLFLISNLYSSEDNFEKSNFYLNLSLFLNPKFVFNLSLVSENQ